MRIPVCLAIPPPGDLPHPGIKPVSPAAPALQADSVWQPTLVFLPERILWTCINKYIETEKEKKNIPAFTKVTFHWRIRVI